MQRSLSGFLNTKIDFNPKQCRSGSSSIDKLPMRRASSLKNIHKQPQKQIQDKVLAKNRKSLKTEQKIQQEMKQNLEYKMEVLRRINQSLTRQNAYLKKQLEYSSSKLIKNTHNQLQGKQRYKQKILMRIGKNEAESKNIKMNKKMQDFTVESTGFGLFNSKLSTARKCADQHILEYYDKFETKGIIPSFENMQLTLDSYLDSIQQNYHKIKQITGAMSKQREVSSKSRDKEQYRRVSEQLQLLQLTVLYRKHPKITKNLFKDPVAAKNTKKQCSFNNIFKITDFCPELSSPTQITTVFEAITKFILKSPKLFDRIKANPYVVRLNKKMRE